MFQGTMAVSVSLNFYAAPPGSCLPCPADINGSQSVDVDDLMFIITHWGATGGPADINHDNFVNIDDLVAVITSWGNCP